MDRRRILMFPVAAAAAGYRGAVAADLDLDLWGTKASVEFATVPDAPLQDLVRRWIEKSAVAVIRYYGKFPVPEVRIKVRLADGRGVKGGQTFPGDPPIIRVNTGLRSTEDDLLGTDWVMVHEMVHLAFPWLDGAHNWMAEGIAVYVESIARVQAVHLSPAQIWADFIKMMPRGLPEAGDSGLDLTRSWGRTYWGGAMFCLEADVRIRRETDNRLGLQHALRAINATRNFSRSWPFRETLELGDGATGRTVLADLYDRWRETAVTPDLNGLWSDLGVALRAGTAVFDNSARLAPIRLAIMRPM